jgi:hypothetical protein
MPIVSYILVIYGIDTMAHLAMPYGGRQDARLEPKYIQWDIYEREYCTASGDPFKA